MYNKFFIVTYFVSFLFLFGCSPAQTVSTFTHPSTLAEKDNSATLPVSKDAAWNAAINSFDNTFFVVENIDKNSGIMTVAYKADDPKLYIDCGTLTITNKTLEEETVFTFPYAQKFVEIMVADDTTQLKPATRTTTLSGKMNIVFRPLAQNQVQVTVNTNYNLDVALNGSRYVPTGIFHGYNQNYDESQTITFNNGEVGFDKLGQQRCVSKNSLERIVLNNIKKQL